MSVPTTGPSKLKKKHIRVKHQKVKLFRANEPLLSVFMWGVNHTINELSHVSIPVMLLPDDFRAYSKLKVDNHLFNKENMPSHFKVKEYCPLVFRNLRDRFAIDDLDYKESLTRFSHPDNYLRSKARKRAISSLRRSATAPTGVADLHQDSIFHDASAFVKRGLTIKRLRSQPIPDDSSGKSGAKFYQSYDRLFILKTLTSEEVERMHSFLKHYHPYIVERHGKTLLPQYLGMYRLTVDGIEHYLVATRNVFSNHLNIHRKYDLKGSTVDREASEKELEKELPTLKDNDFLKQGVRIDIGEAAKEKLLETLTADVEFLTKLHLMDYSLLLGVHECGRGEAEAEAARARPPDADTDRDTDSDSDTDNRHADGWGYNTPPDSPRGFGRQTSLRYEGIIPELDIYAIPSQEGAPKKEIYFVALIDVLTHYGVKKQAAKAAKTVKYGSNVDGISTCDPEQYGKRFIEFVAKAIEGN
ncbi:phosphatidylinositol 5-phosphate 4-kinase type-2 beta isoform X1 [Bombyx mandarina]|uniref:PIPK domain-containing protein n=2 Tax=Bombyx TaxID=7090 RepID=A0A8R2R8L8_BOMMO|nr:phosphatidylinositol 5-phosphate 4-kinase type-2 beta isoform X1 [Bombyx mandarina]XP_037874308.1 phosphatidylinositol 5-phosphate 4-kinase type-2 beta isoform X1 [Bombyx mori]